MDIRSEIVRKNLMIPLTSGFLVLFATNKSGNPLKMLLLF
ncbi:hypothetical protein C2W64_03801 [Brevibacillus laterosporus]|nr:hypothetical protein C2W64_03801 [Brevibacillus laterosporus]